MSEKTLITLLAACEPEEIVLIGEPVFRLERAWLDYAQSSNGEPVNSGADANGGVGAGLGADLGTDVATTVRIDRCASLDDYRQVRETNNLDTNRCVMCMDLPDDAIRPELLLGQGCRLAPRLLVVEHTQRTVETRLLDDEQFFAFGFRLIEKSTDMAGLQCHRYAYSLSEYKRSPDWLNAKFWANPERFDVQD